MAKFTHRTFISVVAALSILITGISAVQAQAGSRDTERALAAIIGLAVLGAIVAKNRERDERRETQKVIRQPDRIEARPLPRDLQAHKKSHGKHKDRRALPRECLFEARTDRGIAQYYGARCLSRNYAYVNRLPDRCERRIRTDRGVRYGWSARCLSREGYTLARR
jgi:hypothetical protein